MCYFYFFLSHEHRKEEKKEIKALRGNFSLGRNKKVKVKPFYFFLNRHPSEKVKYTILP